MSYANEEINMEEPKDWLKEFSYKFAEKMEEETFLEVCHFIEEVKKQAQSEMREWANNFAFLFPYQVKRSKEWTEGYNYCKKGVEEELSELLNKTK